MFQRVMAKPVAWSLAVHYPAGVSATQTWHVLGVKFDSGGGNDNMTMWAEALNATGRVMVIENCNNGGYVPYHTDEGCPFNYFRTGIDNSPSPLSMVSNLLDASRYFNVSKPGCWACERPAHRSYALDTLH